MKKIFRLLTVLTVVMLHAGQTQGVTSKNPLCPAKNFSGAFMDFAVGLCGRNSVAETSTSDLIITPEQDPVAPTGFYQIPDELGLGTFSFSRDYSGDGTFVNYGTSVMGDIRFGWNAVVGPRFCLGLALEAMYVSGGTQMSSQKISPVSRTCGFSNAVLGTESNVRGNIEYRHLNGAFHGDTDDKVTLAQQVMQNVPGEGGAATTISLEDDMDLSISVKSNFFFDAAASLSYILSEKTACSFQAGFVINESYITGQFGEGSFGDKANFIDYFVVNDGGTLTPTTGAWTFTGDGEDGFDVVDIPAMDSIEEICVHRNGVLFGASFQYKFNESTSLLTGVKMIINPDKTVSDGLTFHVPVDLDLGGHESVNMDLNLGAANVLAVTCGLRFHFG